MTANITQNVIPRSRNSLRVFSRLQLPRMAKLSRARSMQRGSVDHTTISMGVGVVALVLVGMLGFFYLRQVVDTASQGTNVQELEQQLGDLNDRQRQLELQGAQLRSLQNVEGKVKELNLVEADHVSYLANEDNRVALNVQP